MAKASGTTFFICAILSFCLTEAHAEGPAVTASDCAQTIHILKSKLDLLTARAKNTATSFNGDEAQSAQVEKRIEKSVEEFVQDAKNWRTKWDFFNKSLHDENPQELTKRVTKELAFSLPGTQVTMTGKPEKLSNRGSEFYSFEYEITYPATNEKLMHDSARLTIEAANLRPKFVSLQEGQPQTKFSYPTGLKAATAASLSKADKSYSAGLEAAIAVLNKSCNISSLEH